MSTPAQRSRMLAEFAVERYAHTLALALAWLFQGGEIPGLELVPQTQIKSFFESTDPNYWQTLMASGPDGHAEAFSQLIQWGLADPNNAGTGTRAT